MRWFSSDHHFFHKKVIELCNRPFSSLEEMHEEMIKRWNDRVKPTDEVHYAGDFAFGGTTVGKSITSRLNGKLIGYWGNHDKKAKELLNRGFHDVKNDGLLHLGRKLVRISHYPYAPKRVDEDTRFLDRRVPDDGHTWLLHGHVHHHYKLRGRMINVGVDVWNFAPVSEDDIIMLIENAEAARLLGVPVEI